MSELSMSAYFPFHRIKIVEQVVDKFDELAKSSLTVMPDLIRHP